MKSDSRNKILWACWHLPFFFFVRGSDTLGQSFPVYLLQVTALSIAMAWLYWRTQGSRLLVMLFHAAVNNTKDIVPSAVPGATNPFASSSSLVAWLTVALLWICAAYFLARMRGAQLEGAGETSNDTNPPVVPAAPRPKAARRVTVNVRMDPASDAPTGA